jgi:hypothetical protein
MISDRVRTRTGAVAPCNHCVCTAKTRSAMWVLRRSLRACGASATISLALVFSSIPAQFLFHFSSPVFAGLKFDESASSSTVQSCFVCERVHPHRHNASLRKLALSFNAISVSMPFSIDMELVLCQMRNTAVMHIDAGHLYFSVYAFDDTDAARIADALRCEHGFVGFPCACLWIFASLRFHRLRSPSRSGVFLCVGT